MSKLEVGSNTYELNVEEILRPAIERRLSGSTKMDIEIEANPIPNKPILLSGSIKLIRWYQKRISPKLGSRCVFEPSCSHFCEVSIREYGLLKGINLTIKRLFRCRPGTGGIDLPNIKGVKTCNTK